VAVNNINVLRSARTVTDMCVALYTNLDFLSIDFPPPKKKPPNIKFRPVKVVVIHADTGTGGHDDLTTMPTRLDIGVAGLITLGG
jgi:hypothetical protein